MARIGHTGQWYGRGKPEQSKNVWLFCGWYEQIKVIFRMSAEVESEESKPETVKVPTRLGRRLNGSILHSSIHKIARAEGVSLSRRALLVLGDVAHHLAGQIGDKAQKMSMSGRMLRKANGKIGMRLLNQKTMEAATLIVMGSGTSLGAEACAGGRRVVKHRKTK